MSKIEFRIKLLILGLLFITAFLIIILIYLPPGAPQESPPASSTTPSYTRSISPKKESKILYFIIDDAGQSIEKLMPFLDFPGEITIAVLPGLQYSRKSAELALKKGKKVILHQPMQAVNNQDPGPHAIKLDYGRK